MMDREWLVSAQDGRVPFPQLVERAAGAGVDYLVAGSVTRLSIEDRSSTDGGVVPLPLIGALIHKHKTESVIGAHDSQSSTCAPAKSSRRRWPRRAPRKRTPRAAASS